MPRACVIVLDAVGTLIDPFPPVAEVYAAAALRQGVRLDLGGVKARFHRYFRDDEVDEMRGPLETDEAIEHSASLLSFDQVNVHRHRFIEGLADSLRGDLVKHHPIDVTVFRRSVQLFLKVLTNRFTLTIRVGRQDQSVGALERFGNVVQPAGGFAIDLPDHLEIVLRIDRSILRGQVADMAEGGQNLIRGAQIFVDRLGFRRRLHDNDIHVFPVAYGKDRSRFRGIREKRSLTRTWVVRGFLSNRQMLKRPFRARVNILMVVHYRPGVVVI